MTTQNDELLTAKEAAKLLKMSHKTLAMWRCTHRYPLAYVRAGRRIRYRRSDIEQFLNTRTERH